MPPPARGAISYVIYAILVALFTPSQGKPLQVKPGCRYEGRRYQEGVLVATSEPCLQCRCIEATLRCRLRVCPRIPSPPPPECHIRAPSEHACCSEMICGESKYEDENSLRRMDMEIENVTEEDGCLFEGVRYGPGSAMIATRRCEYCYCILGARRCVRPKCLLPLPGCVPLYVPHSCCPIAYNCTHDQDGGTSTTTTQSMSLNGCRVGSRVYNEGEMVREIALKAPCDNCFCAMGAVRCVPLACAPPLQGCTPVVREGQCCPSTYNCSGSIEVKATQNYASYAFISKDYANFRKETHFYPAESQVSAILSNAIVEGRGHRIIDGEAYTTDREIIDVTTLGSVPVTEDATSTFETTTMGNEILSDTTAESAGTSTVPTTTSSSTEVLTTTITTTTTTNIDASTTPTYESIDPRNGVSTTPEETETTTNESPTTTTTFPMLQVDQLEDSESQDESKSTTLMSNPSGITSGPETQGDEQSKADNSTEQSPITSTREPGTTSPTTVLVPDDIFVMNVTLMTNVSVGHVQGMTITPPVRSIPPDVEAILNITQREKGEDYDYYSEPTLPPSLPNVRIIPFVAADALVKNEQDTTSGVTAYPSGSAGIMPELQQRPTDNPNFYDIVTRENRFSPPVETEGGFVPRDPPYFEAPYHSTDLSLEIGTGVTVVPADITNPNRKEDGLITDCRFQTRQYRNGEFVPNSGICVTCMCYYGQVVCSDEKCPPLKIGCRRVNAENGCCWKIVCVDEAESPTIVLDRADATAPSQRQTVTSLDGLVTPDPFRDVIKTEPAPDLPSLIEDMLPYLVDRGISKPISTTPMSNIAKAGPPIVQKVDFGENFMGEIPTINSLPIYNYREEIDRRKDDEILVTGSPSSDKEDYNNFHNDRLNHGTSFPAFLEQEVADEQSDDKTGPKFPYRGKVTTEDGVVTVRNSSSQKEVGVGYKASFSSSPSSSGSLRNDSESGPPTTDVLPIKSMGEKTEGVPASSEEDRPDEDEDSIPSFGNVLDLFFLGGTTEKPEVQISIERSDLPTTVFPTSTLTSVEDSFTGGSSTPKTSESSSHGSKSAENPTSSSKLNEKKNTPVVGSLLKLAGCNIYGRMYRVGRIITELSGPCLECRCTEVGVQCKKLSCR